MTTPYQRKLARMEEGLAPEDETFQQATHTGQLRQDWTYAIRWQAFEREYDAALQDLADYTGRHGL